MECELKDKLAAPLFAAWKASARPAARCSAAGGRGQASSVKAWRLEENLLTSLPADLLLGVPAERLCLHVARNPLVAPPAAEVATPALLAAYAGVLRRHPEHLASVSVTLWGFGAHGKSRLSDEVLGRRPFPAGPRALRVRGCAASCVHACAHGWCVARAQT